MVVTVDEGFAGEVEAMLEADFAESLEFTPEDRRSVRRLQQLGMRVARLVSPIL
jgi:cardiolipin synthase